MLWMRAIIPSGENGEKEEKVVERRRSGGDEGKVNRASEGYKARLEGSIHHRAFTSDP